MIWSERIYAYEYKSVYSHPFPRFFPLFFHSNLHSKIWLSAQLFQLSKYQRLVSSSFCLKQILIKSLKTVNCSLMLSPARVWPMESWRITFCVLLPLSRTSLTLSVAMLLPSILPIRFVCIVQVNNLYWHADIGIVWLLCTFISCCCCW